MNIEKIIEARFKAKLKRHTNKSLIRVAKRTILNEIGATIALEETTRAERHNAVLNLRKKLGLLT